MVNPLVIIAAGFGVGVLVGLTSVGGGSLMTPLLIGVFRLSPLAAVGTDLIYQSVTRFTGAVSHARRGTVDGFVFRRLALASIVGALLAAGVMHFLPSQAVRTTLVMTGLGMALMATACMLALEPIIRRYRGVDSEQGNRRPRGSMVLIVGLISGFTVGVTSVGAGALTMTALLILCPALGGRRLVATDLASSALMLPVAAASSAAIHFADLHMAVLLLIGSVPGALAGGRLSSMIPERPLRLSMAGVLLYTGFRLLPI